ncbi:MAG: hypothetical protein ACYC4I_03920 [Minisyncoccota bacterium]
MPATQANVEFWFRLLYGCIRGSCYGQVDESQFSAWLAHLWLWVIVVGYALALAALVVIIYSLVRLFELRKKEKEFYSTLLTTPETSGGANPRWLHIETLATSGVASDWRAAIIEADILLDDLLTREGYEGMGVGEKLKNADASNFSTLQDAWEAHKVRNQIAHEGSSFDLSETLARRTIARYESVFREFNVI